MVHYDGLWSKDDQSLHMCLEFKAAFLSNKAFISNKRNGPFTYCLIIPPQYVYQSLR